MPLKFDLRLSEETLCYMLGISTNVSNNVLIKYIDKKYHYCL